MTLTLANHLTLLRLTAIPFLILFLSYPYKWCSFLSALIFFLAILTDFLDGFFARRQKQITTLGKLLDPLADKLLITAALIMLISLKRVPAWMAFLIIAREIAITGLRSILASEGIVLAASKKGKWKFVLQSFAILCLILHYPYFNIDFHKIGIILLWIAIFFTLWSGIKYFMQFYKTISK